MAKINVKAALMKAVATGGGAVAAASLNKISFVGKQSPLIRGVIKLAAGIFLPTLAKGKANGIFTDVGNGMVAVGATEIANATIFKGKPISIAGDSFPTYGLEGIGEMPFYPGAPDTVNGPAYDAKEEY